MKMSGMTTKTLRWETRNQLSLVRIANARSMRIRPAVPTAKNISRKRMLFLPASLGGSTLERCSFSMWYIGGSLGDPTGRRAIMSLDRELLAQAQGRIAEAAELVKARERYSR